MDSSIHYLDCKHCKTNNENGTHDYPIMTILFYSIFMYFPQICQDPGSIIYFMSFNILFSFAPAQTRSSKDVPAGRSMSQPSLPAKTLNLRFWHFFFFLWKVIAYYKKKPSKSEISCLFSTSWLSGKGMVSHGKVRFLGCLWGYAGQWLLYIDNDWVLEIQHECIHPIVKHVPSKNYHRHLFLAQAVARF